jgi:hypothetical protein
MVRVGNACGDGYCAGLSQNCQAPDANDYRLRGDRCLGELLYCVETSRKDIKFWGIEITVPESDGIKACRAIQATFHEKALGFESERKTTYQLMENDETSIDAFTKLRLEAIAQDRDTYRNDNENVAIGRIKDLIEDSNYREKYAEWLNQTEADDTERVNQECGALLIATSG